ncbi:WRKY transcription factor SUSIBA2-like [Carex rostrata]
MSEADGHGSPEKSVPDPRVQALSAAASGARYKTMSPARLPISREPCLTIPPGFSPSSLLESPVLLTNMKAEPSPTTGTINMSSMMGKIITSGNLASPRDNCVDKLNEDKGSSEFEFKPLPNSSIQSMASLKCAYQHNESAPFFQIQSQTQAHTSNSLPPPNGSGPENRPSNAPQLIEQCPLTDSGPQEPPYDEQINGSDLNASGNLNNVDKSIEDGYNWRKYGQKLVKGSENPRSYYKCTHPNCEVKKQLERSMDGQIKEVVYKGQHNHPKPLPNRRLGLGGAVLPNTGDDKYDGFVEDKLQGNLNPLPSQININGTSDVPPETATGDDGVSVGQCNTGDDMADDEDPESKRRKVEAAALDASAFNKPNREPRVVVQTVSEVDILDDGYRWRKYGQKVVKGNPNPRSYYKCTNMGCPVRKHVERASHDPKSVITTYEGKHNHDVPTARTGSGSGSYDPSTVATPIKPSPSAGNSMFRPCDNNIPVSRPYSRPDGNNSNAISLDLGVGINANQGNNGHYPHMHPANSSGYGSVVVPAVSMVHNGLPHVQNREEDDGFSFKTTPINHSSSLCYTSTGNLVLGP